MSLALATLPPESLPVPSRHPVTVYLARLAPGSRRTMRGALARAGQVLAPGVPVEAIPWGALTYAHMQALRAKLATEVSSPAYANRILAGVRGVCREAANLGRMSHEAFAALRDVPGVRGVRLPRGRALTAAEVQALVGACDPSTLMGARDLAVVALLFGGGLRRAEASALALAHVEPDGSAVTVRGKGNKDRKVPLPPDAQTALAAWVTQRGPEAGPLLASLSRYAVLRRRADTGDLRGLSCGGIAVVLARVAERAGVDPFSPHDARRTRITNLFAAGHPLVVIQKLAGHSKAETTARYDRSGDLAMRRAAEAVGLAGTSP